MRKKFVIIASGEFDYSRKRLQYFLKLLLGGAAAALHEALQGERTNLECVGC
jgi:hypothetical protein